MSPELPFAYGLSAAVLVAADLGVLEALGDTPRVPASLAAELDLDPGALDRLLVLLAALGAVARVPGGYREAPGVRALTPFLVHSWRTLWPLFGRLPEAVRGGGPLIAVYDRPAAEQVAMADALAALGAGAPAALAAAVDLSRVRTVLDLGGGVGHVGRALAAAHPGLRVVSVDLPAPTEAARARGVAFGERFRCVAADLREPLPVDPADLVLLSGVLADFPREEAARILVHARAVVAAGGTLAIRETLLDDDGGGAVLPAFLSVVLLLSTRGATFRRAELVALVEAAGFGRIRFTGDLLLADPG